MAELLREQLDNSPLLHALQEIVGSLAPGRTARIAGAAGSLTPLLCAALQRVFVRGGAF